MYIEQRKCTTYDAIFTSYIVLYKRMIIRRTAYHVRSTAYVNISGCALGNHCSAIRNGGKHVAMTTPNDCWISGPYTLLGYVCKGKAMICSDRYSSDMRYTQ